MRCRTANRLPVRLRRAMSLVEVLISLGVAAMLLSAVSAAFVASAAAIEENDEHFRCVQAARVCMMQILTEIRRAHAVSVPHAGRVDLITSEGSDRSYLFDPSGRRLLLITNDDPGDRDYELVGGLSACSFAAETVTDAGGIRHVVRVTASLVVESGNNRIRLTGSAAPRREQAYR